MNCREGKSLQLYPNWGGHIFITKLLIKNLLTIKPKSKKHLSQQRSLHTICRVSSFLITHWNFHEIIPTQSHMTYNKDIGQIPDNNSDVVSLCSEVNSVSPNITQAATWNTDSFCIYLNMKSVTKDIHTTSAQKKSFKTLMANIHWSYMDTFNVTVLFIFTSVLEPHFLFL